MESITALLYDAVISGLNYHETEVEDRVYRQVDRWAEKGGRKEKAVSERPDGAFDTVSGAELCPWPEMRPFARRGACFR